MMGDARLFPYDIEVEMDGGKAVLSGRVATEEDKRRAEEIAQHLDPVNQVVNKLEVVKDLGTSIAKRHDHTLLQLVKERFARTETLKAAGFDVKCEQGIIYLSGTVRFQVLALEAAQAARQVPGVRAVDASNVQLIGEKKE
jgi:hyperosmotically inducible protein